MAEDEGHVVADEANAADEGHVADGAHWGGEGRVAGEGSLGDLGDSENGGRLADEGKMDWGEVAAERAVEARLRPEANSFEEGPMPEVHPSGEPTAGESGRIRAHVRGNRAARLRRESRRTAILRHQSLQPARGLGPPPRRRRTAQ
jgi:hypothetical protein